LLIIARKNIKYQFFGFNFSQIDNNLLDLKKGTTFFLSGLGAVEWA